MASRLNLDAHLCSGRHWAPIPNGPLISLSYFCVHFSSEFLLKNMYRGAGYNQGEREREGRSLSSGRIEVTISVMHTNTAGIIS